MAVVTAALIGGGASLLGGAMSSQATSAANAANIAANADARNWMTEMSNTAEQRHVADLKAAGLNPALAYGTPAPVPGAPPVPNIQAATGAGQGVSQAGQIASQVAINSAQVAKARADTAASQAAASNTQADTQIKLATLPYSGAQAKADLDRANALTNELNQSAWSIAKDYDLKTQNVANLMQDYEFKSELNPILIKMNEVDLARMRAGLPRLLNDSAWQSLHPQLSGLLQSGAVGPAQQVIGNVAGMGRIGFGGR